MTTVCPTYTSMLSHASPLDIISGYADTHCTGRVHHYHDHKTGSMGLSTTDAGVRVHRQNGLTKVAEDQ